MNQWAGYSISESSGVCARGLYINIARAVCISCTLKYEFQILG